MITLVRQRLHSVLVLKSIRMKLLGKCRNGVKSGIVGVVWANMSEHSRVKEMVRVDFED